MVREAAWLAWGMESGSGSERQMPTRPLDIARQGRRERLKQVKATAELLLRAPGVHRRTEGIATAVVAARGGSPLRERQRPMKRGGYLVERTHEHITPGRIGDKLEQGHPGGFCFQVAIDGGMDGGEGLRDSIA